MNRAAFLWIFSIFSISFCKCGSHTTEPYSKVDLTSAIYADFRQCGRFRWMKPRVELAEILEYQKAQVWVVVHMFEDGVVELVIE